jgi:hypothetical protein
MVKKLGTFAIIARNYITVIKPVSIKVALCWLVTWYSISVTLPSILDLSTTWKLGTAP